MPIFEYKCADCGHVTERLERGDETGGRRCEECGSEGLRREFSSFSARVKPQANRSACESCRERGTCAFQ